MTLNDLLAAAYIIKTETAIDANSAARIGAAFEIIITFFNDLNSSSNAANNTAIGNAISIETQARQQADNVLSQQIGSAISIEAQARNTAITQAINALVNGAPAAFDTLMEIAGALQGDQSVINWLLSAIATKVDKTALLSVTTPTDPTNLAVGQQCFNSGSKKILTVYHSNDAGINMWDAGVLPTAGVIYLFGSTNYVWNGLEFFELGKSASNGGSGLNSVEATVLTDFNDILSVGVYTITGPLNGFYIGSFEYPNVIQTVIWDNKIFKRGVNVSGQTIIYPPFTEAYATNEAVALKANLVGGIVPYTELPPTFTGKIDVKFWQNSQPDNPLDSDYWLDQTMPHHSVLSIFSSTELHWNPLVVDSTKIYKNLNDNSIWTWGGDSMVPISDPILYASQIEAQTGTENTKVMTAIRTVQSWYYQAKNYIVSELNTVSKTIVGAINELKSGKADLVAGVVPVNELPTTLVNSYELQSITTVPDDFVSGQRYYNASDNKIYLCVGGSTGVVDWSNYAKGQVLKFGGSYYTYSDKLNSISSKGGSYTLDFQTNVLVLQEINMEGTIQIIEITGINVASLTKGITPITLGVQAIPIPVANNEYLTWSITRTAIGLSSVGIKYIKV